MKCNHSFLNQIAVLMILWTHFLPCFYPVNNHASCRLLLSLHTSNLLVSSTLHSHYFTFTNSILDHFHTLSVSSIQKAVPLFSMSQNTWPQISASDYVTKLKGWFDKQLLCFELHSVIPIVDLIIIIWPRTCLSKCLHHSLPIKNVHHWTRRPSITNQVSQM